MKAAQTKNEDLSVRAEPGATSEFRRRLHPTWSTPEACMLFLSRFELAFLSLATEWFLTNTEAEGEK